MYDRLTKWEFEGCASVNGCSPLDADMAKAINRLCDLEDKIEQGKIVELPCKVGDTVYAISQMRDKRILPFINTYEVTSITLRKKKCVIYHEMDGFIKIFKQDDFGKTVFLTREEAEKALERSGNGKS